MRSFIFSFLFLLSALAAHAVVDSSRIISTIAGGDTSGFWGDGGPANRAGVLRPIYIARDRFQNIYFVDCYNLRIRKIDTNNIITTVVGGGSFDIAGDTIAATLAGIHGVNGICVDRDGNIYFTDIYHIPSEDGVFKVTPSGLVYRIVGGFGWGYNGDSIPARLAQLNCPWGIDVDTFGNIFVSERYGYRIRKIDTSLMITTIAGNGSRTAFGDSVSGSTTGVRPLGLCVGPGNEIYFSDSVFIRKIDSNGYIRTVAGNGIGGCFIGTRSVATATFGGGIPQMTMDDSGNVWGANEECNQIFCLRNSSTVQTIPSNDTICSVDLGDGGDCMVAHLCLNTGVVRLKNGHIYITDHGDNRIRCIGCKYRPDAVLTLENSPDFSITVSPNPVCGSNLTFSITSSSHDIFPYRITDLSGGTLISGETQPNINTSIPFTLPDGAYILTVGLPPYNKSTMVLKSK